MLESSPLLVDGQVYIGDEDGDMAIFPHGIEPKLPRMPYRNPIPNHYERYKQDLIRFGAMTQECHFPTASGVSRDCIAPFVKPDFYGGASNGYFPLPIYLGNLTNAFPTLLLQD